MRVATASLFGEQHVLWRDVRQRGVRNEEGVVLHCGDPCLQEDADSFLIEPRTSSNNEDDASGIRRGCRRAKRLRLAR